MYLLTCVSRQKRQGQVDISITYFGIFFPEKKFNLKEGIQFQPKKKRHRSI